MFPDVGISLDNPIDDEINIFPNPATIRLVRKIAALALILALILISLPVEPIQAADVSGGLFLAHFDDNTQNERDGDSGISSGISYGAGKFGNGAVFDGTDLIQYSASGNISRTAGTIEFWYKPDYSWSTTNKTAILFMYDDNSTVRSYLTYFVIQGHNIAGSKTQLIAEIVVESAGVTQTLTSSASTTWTAGSLHHIAVSWDSDAFKLYVDGSLEDSISSPTLLDVDRNTICFGNDVWAEPFSALGTIDEFLITNNVRSASDIASDYAASSSFSIATTTTTTTTDTTAPSISDVAVSGITKTTATVGWTTDENSDSFVEYGTSNAYGTSIGQEVDSVTSHLVSFAGLNYGTTYHYRVKSTDSADNQAVSSDYSFTTVDLDRVPPEISFNPIESIYSTLTPVISSTPSSFNF